MITAVRRVGLPSTSLGLSRRAAWQHQRDSEASQDVVDRNVSKACYSRYHLAPDRFPFPRYLRNRSERTDKTEKEGLLRLPSCVNTLPVVDISLDQAIQDANRLRSVSGFLLNGSISQHLKWTRRCIRGYKKYGRRLLCPRKLIPTLD